MIYSKCIELPKKNKITAPMDRDDPQTFTAFQYQFRAK